MGIAIDAFSDLAEDGRDYRHELSISFNSPLDIIQGTGLDQEFDLVSPRDNGRNGAGFFRSTVDGAMKLMTFIVDRVSVTKQLSCRP